MKALVYTKTNKVEYLDYKDPEFKKDESIVKVSASGIWDLTCMLIMAKTQEEFHPLY